MTLQLNAAASASDGTTRYSAVADDGAQFEVVYQPWPGNPTVCASAQAGCGYGCRHCATTYATIPFQRSLRADEITDAVTQVRDRHAGEGLRTVDFSGIGDSSRNWTAVSHAAARLLAEGVCDEAAVTSIAPKNWVKRLLDTGEPWWPTRFMFSLHGATLATRRQVVTNAEDPVRAIGGWQAIAARCPVTLNYTLHKDNTGTDDARHLITLLHGREDFAELRLSPLNVVAGTPLSAAHEARAFIDQVRDGLPDWTIAEYAHLGTDVDAGCGQLRSRAIRPLSG